MKCPEFAKDIINSVRKNSPQLLIAGGIVAGGVSIFLACKASYKKLGETVELKNQHIKKIDDSLNDETGQESLTVKEARSDKVDVYREFVFELVKMYGPAALTSALSITCILASYKIIDGRNVALSAALATTTEAFKTYRQKVRNEGSIDIDELLYNNVAQEKITEVEVGEDGKEHKVKKTVSVSIGDLGENSYWFTPETSDYCQDNIKLDENFLVQTRSELNDRLTILSRKRAGKSNLLFLNEALEALGLEKSADGQKFGWSWNPEEESEHHVFFDIYQAKIKSESYTNGFKDGLYIEFSPLEYLLDKM